VAIGLFIFIYNNKLNSNYEIVPRISEQPKEVVEQHTDEPRRWKSSETGLPMGIVLEGAYIEGLPSSNWLSIKTIDGTTTIVKNIDWQLHDAINNGDIIE
jgi:hypothetical protein